MMLHGWTVEVRRGPRRGFIGRAWRGGDRLETHEHLTAGAKARATTNIMAIVEIEERLREDKACLNS